MARIVLLLSLLLLSTATMLCSACKAVAGTVRYSASETFRAAPLVVLGTVSGAFHSPPLGPSPPITSRHVLLTVNCTFKWAPDWMENGTGNETGNDAGNVGNVSQNEAGTSRTIPDIITLSGNGMYHSCFHSELEMNETYLLALNREPQDPEGWFRVFEPNVASVGTYMPTEENYEAAEETCGFSEGFRGAVCRAEVCDGVGVSKARKLAAGISASLLLLLVAMCLV